MPRPVDDLDLTVRQAQFVGAYVANGGHGADAIRSIAHSDYASEESVRTAASDLLSKPNVQEAIRKALDKHKLTPDWAAERIADAGEATDSKGSKDHNTRLRAVDMALKLQGAYPNAESSTLHLHAHKHESSFDSMDAETLHIIAAFRDRHGRLPNKAELRALLAEQPQPQVIDATVLSDDSKA